MRDIPPALLALAEFQASVVTRAQCQEHGLGASTLAALLRQGRWQRAGHGVYVTHNGPPSDLTRVWVAVLGAGPGAMASHQTSLWLAKPVGRLWLPCHVAVPEERRVSSRPGIVVHRLHDLDRPLGAPPRMAVERSAMESIHLMTRFEPAATLICEVVGSRLTMPDRLRVELERRPRQRWRRDLTDMLSDVEVGARSPLEIADLHNDRAHGLVLAVRQVSLRMSGQQLWQDVRMQVPETGAVLSCELDGRLGHDGTGRFRDMQRDNFLVIRGDTPLRFGWTDVRARGCETTALKIWALRRLGWRGTTRPCGQGCRVDVELARLAAAVSAA